MEPMPSILRALFQAPLKQITYARPYKFRAQSITKPQCPLSSPRSPPSPSFPSPSVLPSQPAKMASESPYPRYRTACSLAWSPSPHPAAPSTSAAPPTPTAPSPPHCARHTATRPPSASTAPAARPACTARRPRPCTSPRRAN